MRQGGLLRSRRLIASDDNYWSSTEHADNPSNAWNWNSYNGNLNNNNKDNANRVRCVQALPPPALGLFRILMETIFTFEKLYKAYKDCLKHKKNTANALVFALKCERNLFDLVQELRGRTYTVSRHICFVITRPTVREIFAADFRDRVVHHLLYNELHDIFDRMFIDHSYANRVNKGTHKAAQQLRAYLAECPNGYALKLDIKSFFRSIDKQILYSILERALVSRCGRGGYCSLE